MKSLGQHSCKARWKAMQEKVDKKDLSRDTCFGEVLHILTLQNIENYISE